MQQIFNITKKMQLNHKQNNIRLSFFTTTHLPPTYTVLIFSKILVIFGKIFQQKIFALLLNSAENYRNFSLKNAGNFVWRRSQVVAWLHILQR